MTVPTLILTSLICTYTYQGFPFATIQLGFAADGTVNPQASVTMQGQTHDEPVTSGSLGAGEVVHVWLSKESPQNAVEMIVYDPPQASGESVLINHNVPVGQDVWGNCQE